MEVRATGEYYLIHWSKDNVTIPFNDSDSVLDSFPHFTEIYFIEPTTRFDVGIYEVFAQDIDSLVVTDIVQFAVVLFGMSTFTLFRVITLINEGFFQTNIFLGC